MYKGKVISKKDILGKGTLTVVPTGSDEYDAGAYISVKYQSFYGGGKFAGSVFVPETGTEITYDKCENDPDDEWYYVGSILNPSSDKMQTANPMPSDKNPTLGAELTYPHDPDDGKYNVQSMSYGISSPLGHEILMLEGRDKDSDNKGIRLMSSGKRGLTIDDSSDSRQVNLHSAFNGAQLLLTDIKGRGTDESLGPESANLHSVGDVIIDSNEGQIKLRVQDGRNIGIANNSTQSHATKKLSGGEIFRGSSGNIIIESNKGDISLRNHGNGIFIDCIGAQQGEGETGASFQVRSNNKISLFAQNGIDIKSTGDINIAGASVNIQSDVGAGGTIQLNSETNINNNIGIRKTNIEIDMEGETGVPKFFGSNNGWDVNYTFGPNTDSNKL